MAEAAKNSIQRFSFTEPTLGELRRFFWAGLKTILSFGYLFFKTRSEYRGSLASRISIDGVAFHYHEAANEDFQSFLSFIRIFGTLILVCQYAKSSHPDWVISLNIMIFFAGLIGYVLLRYQSRMDLLKRISWKKQFLTATPNRISFVKSYLNWSLLSLLSLGLALPWRRHYLFKMMIESLRFQELPLQYEGKTREFALLYLKGLFLSLLTLGVYWSWHQAAILNYQANHIRMGDFRFRSILRGQELFWLNLETLVLLVGSLGLAWPWILEHRMQLRIHRLAVISSVTSIQQQGVRDGDLSP